MRRNPLTTAGRAACVIAFGLAVIAPQARAADGNDDAPAPAQRGRLTRLFRIGGGSTADSTPSSPPTSVPRADLKPVDPGAFPSYAPAPSPPVGGFGFTNNAPATAASPAPSAENRLVPRPRTTRAVTEAEPVVTRVALGRSSDGMQFAMFMQVYADGTVIDSEGVHRASREALKPVMDVLRSGELMRVHGHCGGPPTDFVEEVHLTVYERRLGMLRANTFSFSGNPDGCDHSVKHLNAALDALQAKIAKPAGVATAAAPAAPTPVPAHAPQTPDVNPAQRRRPRAAMPALPLEPGR